MALARLFGGFIVVGHRGKGMNALHSPDRRFREVKENTLKSFDAAGEIDGVEFVEFDVQVTKDDHPIIFHDDTILTQGEGGVVIERRVTDLTLEEFYSYGPQTNPETTGLPLLRKTPDGKVVNWDVEIDAPSCTLLEAFKFVRRSLGFNIELKFDDEVVYREEELSHTLEVILKCVYDHAYSREVFFSSFNPDAARLMKKLQNKYAVFFLTNGGNEIYADPRRNSLEAALKHCQENALDGVVSEVKAVFRNPSIITKIRDAGLSIMTYGRLNNVREAVYLQYELGINGVIVDLVEEITNAVVVYGAVENKGSTDLSELETELKVPKPKFSQKEISFLLRLIPELLQ